MRVALPSHFGQGFFLLDGQKGFEPLTCALEKRRSQSAELLARMARFYFRPFNAPAVAYFFQVFAAAKWALASVLIYRHHANHASGGIPAFTAILAF